MYLLDLLGSVAHVSDLHGIGAGVQTYGVVAIKVGDLSATRLDDAHSGSDEPLAVLVNDAPREGA